MKARKVMPLACVVLFLTTGISAFRAQNPGKPKQKKADYPVLDLNAPEPADPEERAKRKKKGEKYDNSTPFPFNPARENARQAEPVHFPPGIPALPFSESAAVIIGTVTGAHAHLSADRSYVYSEFDILVEEVVKDDLRSPISVGQTVAAERPGGKVLVRPGNIHEFISHPPLGVKNRYAVFLRRRGDDYHVFTAHKLEGGLVYPVDDFFDDYKEAKEEDFMRDLRQAATSGEQTPRSALDDSPGTLRDDEPPDAEPPPTDPEGDCRLPSPPPCVAPQPDFRPRFSPGTVTVTYNPDHFSPAEVQALRNGYMVWNNVGNVTFTEPTPSRDRPAAAAANVLHFESQEHPTDREGNPRDGRVNVSGGSCVDGECSAQATVFLKRGLPLTARAYCQNNRGYIEYNDYEQLVAHEVGHPLGLNDTYSRTENSRGISIMDGRSYHLRNGILTDCDKQTVARTYPKPTPTPTPTPSCQDADADGWCNDVDCNDYNPNETNNCAGPYHYETYFDGPEWNCYNVYDLVTTYTCVDGRCADPQREYVLVDSYCSH